MLGGGGFMLVHEFHNFIISENGLGILVGVPLEIQKLGYTEQYHKLSMLLSNSGSDVMVNDITLQLHCFALKKLLTINNKFDNYNCFCVTSSLNTIIIHVIF